jgi:hypothetical protein
MGKPRHGKRKELPLKQEKSSFSSNIPPMRYRIGF